MIDVSRIFSPTQVPQPLSILCLGAHSDDLEIGCGGTLVRLLAGQPQVSVYWVVLAAHGQRAEEARGSAVSLLSSISQKQIVIKDFRDGYLPYDGDKVKDYFETLKRAVTPDLVFTHYRNDLHQDHRLINELTWNTFRNHAILEYEILKYDGDLGSPNVFVPLDAETVARKIHHLQTHFQTQNGKHWFTDDAFRSLMRIRGLECGGETAYAEAFYGRKVRLG